MPQRKVQFCPRGHDTFVVGRSKSNECRQCVRDRDKVYNRRPEVKARRSEKFRLDYKEGKTWKQENLILYRISQRKNKILKRRAIKQQQIRDLLQELKELNA
jgi:hypothetical protein